MTSRKQKNHNESHQTFNSAPETPHPLKTLACRFLVFQSISMRFNLVDMGWFPLDLVRVWGCLIKRILPSGGSWTRAGGFQLYSRGRRAAQCQICQHAYTGTPGKHFSGMKTEMDAGNGQHNKSGIYLLLFPSICLYLPGFYHSFKGPSLRQWPLRANVDKP